MIPGILEGRDRLLQITEGECNPRRYTFRDQTTMSDSTISRHLKFLEIAGLLTRHGSVRDRYWNLTDAGREYLANASKVNTRDLIAPIITETYGSKPMAHALIEYLAGRIDAWPQDRERQIMLVCWDWFSGGDTAASVAAKIEKALTKA